MAEKPEPRPALAFVKRNAAVLGLVVLVAGGAGAVAITQATAAQPTAQASPLPIPTVGLGQPGVSPTAGAGKGHGTTNGATPGTGASNATTGSQSGAQPTRTAAPTTAPSPTPRVIGTDPQAPTEQDFHKNAEAFAQAWINTTGGKDAWLARLKPLITPGLYQSFTYTDISRIPTATYSGVGLDEKFPGNIRFTGMYTNGKALYKAIDQLQPDGTWLVSQLGSPN